MINPEDDAPRPVRRLLTPPALDSLGVAELAAYIADLETEILRVRTAIAAKDAHRSAASGFFRNTGPAEQP